MGDTAQSVSNITVVSEKPVYGEMAVLVRNADHVHTEEGVCLKNRMGDLCHTIIRKPLENPTVEFIVNDMSDEELAIWIIRKERDAVLAEESAKTFRSAVALGRKVLGERQ